MPQPVTVLNMTLSRWKDWKLKQGNERKPGKVLMARENQEPRQESRSEHSRELKKRGGGVEGNEKESSAGSRQWETDGQGGGQAICGPSRASRTPVLVLLHHSRAWLSPIDSGSGCLSSHQNESPFGKKLLINKLVKIKGINHITSEFILSRLLFPKSWMPDTCSPGTYYWWTWEIKSAEDALGKQSIRSKKWSRSIIQRKGSIVD